MAKGEKAYGTLKLKQNNPLYHKELIALSPSTPFWKVSAGFGFGKPNC